MPSNNQDLFRNTREHLAALVKGVYGGRSHWRRYAWSSLLLGLVFVEIFYSRGENILFLLKSRYAKQSLNDSVDAMYMRLNQQELVDHSPERDEPRPGTIAANPRVVPPRAPGTRSPSQTAFGKQASSSSKTAPSELRRNVNNNIVGAAPEKMTRGARELHVRWEN
jgi:hypothetical protein